MTENSLITKVLYDYQAFDMQTHGGISRCICELYKQLPDTVQATFGIEETDNVYLNQLGFPTQGTAYRHFLSKNNFPLKKAIYKAYYNIRRGHPSRWDKSPLLNEFKTMDLLNQADYDIFHPTFFDTYFLNYLNGKPFVLTIHDMTEELFPQYYPANSKQILGKQILAPLAAHIIAVSEQTRKDIIRLLGVAEEKITVIYHGVDESPYVPGNSVAYDFEYILYVGARWPYKNFNTFCKYCKPILERHPNIKIVCTSSPFTKEEQSFLDALGIADKVVHRFAKSDQELGDLYHHAIAFVYPSEYEGFGIPILEAYKADCPVMLNNTSCFPEIAGDAAIYFKMSKESSDFEEQFETLYHLNTNERESLLNKQRQRMQMFSWKKAAKQLADVYQNVMSRK